MNLYLTQDRIGTQSGGGAATYHEYRALAAFSEEVHPIDAVRIHSAGNPFELDAQFARIIRSHDLRPALVHIYAGCFTEAVHELKERGARITYTAAAHDIDESRKELEALGGTFDYPHLVTPELRRRYLMGYLEADVLICPSKKSAEIMRRLGRQDPIQIIPHGCEVNFPVPSLPTRFAIGYMGQGGTDKGLRYLFQAWAKLQDEPCMRDKPAPELVIAGGHTNEILPLWRAFGRGSIRFLGFVKSLAEFYREISVYIQPSVTEGFGMEVLEAMAHGRPVIVSEGAGAVDAVVDGVNGFAVRSRDVDAMVERIIHFYKAGPEERAAFGLKARECAQSHEWLGIESRYVAVWERLL